MTKKTGKLNLFAAVAILAYFVINLIIDLTHPELWSDWKHDPRVYLPVMAVGLVVLIPLLAAYLLFGDWQTRRQIKRMSQRGKRVRALMDVVPTNLAKAGRVQEAFEAVDLCVRMGTTINERKQGDLISQFEEKYRDYL